MLLIKKGKEKYGFTLIEILVTISILVVVVMVGFNFLYTAVQSSGKAEIMKEIKQNGSYAISVMESVVRSASKLTCSPDSLTILNPRGESTTFNVTNSKISSGSAFLTSPSISVSYFTIACSIEPGKPASVDISFTLSKTGADLRASEMGTLKFQTKVIVKNYQQ